MASLFPQHSLLLVLSIVVCCIGTSTAAWPQNSTVYMYNYIAPNTNLAVHCRSKTEDPGLLEFAYGVGVKIDIIPSFLYPTVYSCDMSWGSESHKFDIFIDRRDDPRCRTYEKEPEMQIGLPTDVKHVAHIGWDGPSANTPSWMTGFKSAPELSASEPLSLIGEAKSPFTNKMSFEDVHQIEQNGKEKPKHRSRRSMNTNGSALNSPTRASSDAPKPSRRNHNSNFDSPSRDSSVSSRISRRHQTLSPGLESPSHEQPVIPKQSRRKKSKGGSGGSSKSSRSKGQNPVETSSDAGYVPEYVEGLKSKEDQQRSLLETYEEEK
ncbi:hypothetical protein HS088_TW13G01457 [Tripterygium wilfordii]|uniref:CRIB domain-containing protein n=1 Tax=Tripterygium wilfordii TaxID=458696 RepID=A0A7J7CWS5_TRIWF|nr:hypothetical protein HS088_TW13G01457 [Tripterygium wilfordii]